MPKAQSHICKRRRHYKSGEFGGTLVQEEPQYAEPLLNSFLAAPGMQYGRSLVLKQFPSPLPREFSAQTQQT